MEVNLKCIRFIGDNTISDFFQTMFLRYNHRVDIKMDRYELERHDFIDSKDMNMIRFTVT